MQLSKEEYAKNEFAMVVQFKLKIPSHRITVRHHEASIMVLNSYPRDRIFSANLTTIKDSYNLACKKIMYRRQGLIEF